jgi:hypothetical protein
MLQTIVLIAAIGAGVLAANRWLPDFTSKDDRELCWSCGLRAHHKLWCPNR